MTKDKAAHAAKSAKTRKKLLKKKTKKRKRDESEEDSDEGAEEESDVEESSNKKSKTTKSKKSKPGATKPKKTSKATKPSKKAKLSKAAAAAKAAAAKPDFQADLTNAAIFKVQLYNRVSSPELQVLDDDKWRYASIHVHKKNAHVVIWYGGFEYEGLGLKKTNSYSLQDLTENEIFTGDNARLLDGDGDGIECKRGPPKPLPIFKVEMYNKVSAEEFQVEGQIPGDWKHCSLWQLKKVENQHCTFFYVASFFFLVEQWFSHIFFLCSLFAWCLVQVSCFMVVVSTKVWETITR